MTRRISTLLATLLLVCCFAAPATEAQAQFTSDNFHIGPSGGQVAAVGIGVGVALGVGIYFIARAPRTNGCVMKANAGYELQGPNPGDPLYLLEGDTSNLKAGDRMKVIGRKRKTADNTHTLRISKVAKDYGPCAALPASGTSPVKP